MADFGIGEAALASEIAGETGLATLPTSVLSAEAAFGAPAAAGLVSPAVTGIAGLTGAGAGGAMAGLGETPYLSAYSDAINAGKSIPEASQAALQASNTATQGLNPGLQQLNDTIAAQNAANQGLPATTQLPQGADTTTQFANTAAPNAPEPVNAPLPSDTTSTNGFKPLDTANMASKAAPSSGLGDLWSGIKNAMPESTLGKVGLGLGALTAYDKLFGPKYGVPKQQAYNGPLSKFKYDPGTFRPTFPTPSVYRTVYAADGGLMGNPQDGIAGLGNSGMFPTSQQQNPRYAVPSQMPVGAHDVRLNSLPPTPMAAGGSTHSDLGGYSDGGRMLKGPGDGMSDSIPASISGKQPARLADGEFVVPADVVSHLGNGSTDAGAKQLYAMMDKVRKARTGTKKQGKQINPNKYLKV